MNPNHLTTQSKEVHLLSSEKRAMKASILRAAGTVTAPTRIPSPFFSYTFIARLSTATLVVLIVAGSGISYAAQKSGPGDTLYALELSVLEPIEESLQNTPKKKVAYHTQRLEERLTELKKASKVETDPAKYVSFTNQAVKHATAIETALNEEGEQGKKIDTLVEVSALMQANEDILEDIHVETDAFDDSEKHVRQTLTQTSDAYSNTEEAVIRGAVLEGLEDTEIASTTDEVEAETLTDQFEILKDDIESNNFKDAFKHSIDVRIETLKQKLLLEDEEENDTN